MRQPEAVTADGASAARACRRAGWTCRRPDHPAIGPTTRPDAMVSRHPDPREMPVISARRPSIARTRGVLGATSVLSAVLILIALATAPAATAATTRTYYVSCTGRTPASGRSTAAARGGRSPAPATLHSGLAIVCGSSAVAPSAARCAPAGAPHRGPAPPARPSPSTPTAREPDPRCGTPRPTSM